MQTDPVGCKDQVNLYAYVNNDPIGNRDPTGQDCENNHGTTYCFTKDYDVSFPTPTGFQDIRPWIPYYHKYDTPTASPRDAQTTREWVKNNPTPGTPSPATPEGTPNSATPKGLPVNSPVMSFYVTNRVDGNKVVVNVTLPDPPLGNGVVIRDTVVNPDGKTSTIHNYGEGNGFLQSSESPLAGTINNVWTYMVPPPAPAGCTQRPDCK